MATTAYDLIKKSIKALSRELTESNRSREKRERIEKRRESWDIYSTAYGPFNFDTGTPGIRIGSDERLNFTTMTTTASGTLSGTFIGPVEPALVFEPVELNIAVVQDIIPHRRSSITRQAQRERSNERACEKVTQLARGFILEGHEGEAKNMFHGNMHVTIERDCITIKKGATE